MNLWWLLLLDVPLFLFLKAFLHHVPHLIYFDVTTSVGLTSPVELYTYIVLLVARYFLFILYIEYVISSICWYFVRWIDIHFFICRFYNSVIKSFNGSSKEHKVPSYLGFICSYVCSFNSIDLYEVWTLKMLLKLTSLFVLI